MKDAVNEEHKQQQHRRPEHRHSSPDLNDGQELDDQYTKTNPVGEYTPIFEETPPLPREKSLSPNQNTEPITDAQLNSVTVELSEMDHEEESADPTSSEILEPLMPQTRSFNGSKLPKSKDKIKSTSNEIPHSGTTSITINQPPITVDRATRQALTEQYRLGLKRIATNVVPADDTSRRYHTLTHVGRSSSGRLPAEIVHTTYVNAIDVQDLVHYTRLSQLHTDHYDGPGHPFLESSVPPDELHLGTHAGGHSPCRTHTLPRPTVSPLWIETHSAGRQSTPIQEPFTVASQHDALLSELYNRGSGDPLITNNSDVV
ncbi:unnamed protein product [Echinostoma caproni]|uniref:Uncharacterized protein n=1 Tax=Echinostoma caproni TaxID=27848 RepID=A0A183AHT9_9TREM|nr:unnamed protein product [Echinostoma caproni]